MADDNSQADEVDEEKYLTVAIHGRDFSHYALANGVYFEPIDENEQARLRSQHDVFMRLFNNKLIFPEFEPLQQVLDCGAGAGVWALEVARQHPDCQVFAVDISPHMMPWTDIASLPNQNLTFELVDLNMPMDFASNQFDLVNSSMLAGGIHANRWEGYVRDIFRILRPGGWGQMVEVYFNMQSSNGSMQENSPLRVWSESYLASLERFKDPRVGGRLSSLMDHAGFEGVAMRQFDIPLNGWADDEQSQDIGLANRDNVNGLLSSMAIYPFTEWLGMPIIEFQHLMVQARLEAARTDIKPYFRLYVCIGRKPRQRQYASRGSSGKIQGWGHHHGSSSKGSSSSQAGQRKRNRH